ncbi:MAG: RHS repeat-associated core domain-containing protein, partial [Nitrospira sp.]|nr:RHS repeat-associated core domain-containing protein [Nitrospira sp.]
GAPATTYGYEPFGKTTVTGTSSNAVQFTGRENDGTGLYYYRARYYSPRMGRFVSEDPSAADAENVYPYVDNSPLNFIDPTGRVVQYPAGDCVLTYNKPPTATERVAPLTEIKLCALQKCFGQTLIITGGAESHSHKARAHKEGRAVDFGFNSNQSIDPGKNPAGADKFLCCAKKAGFGYGIKEPPPGKDPQYHLEAFTNRPGQQKPSSGYPNVLPNSSKCPGC